jgi:hypothetical protein
MDMRGTDANNIYACGFDYYGPAVYKYNGSTWALVDVNAFLPAKFDARGIYVNGPNDFWIVGAVNVYDGSMAHYLDGTWTVTSPSFATGKGDYKSVDGNADYMMTVGAYGVAAYYDGIAWQDITSADHLTWRCVRVADNGEALFCGERGMARLFADNICSDELYLNYAYEHFYSVILYGTQAWLVGENGRAYKTAINPAPCDSPLAADMNCDYVVDLRDIIVIADEWLNVNPYLYPLF